MGGKSTSGRPTRRRYPPEEKARAARLVRRAQGARHDARDGPAGGPTRPAAGVEPLRARVEQADTDKGIEPGPRTTEAKRTKEPEQEQENHGLRRANDPLKRARPSPRRNPTAPRNDHRGHRRRPCRVRSRGHPQAPAGASEQPTTPRRNGGPSSARAARDTATTQTPLTLRAANRKAHGAHKGNDVALRTQNGGKRPHDVPSSPCPEAVSSLSWGPSPRITRQGGVFIGLIQVVVGDFAEACRRRQRAACPEIINA